MAKYTIRVIGGQANPDGSTAFPAHNAAEAYTKLLATKRHFLNSMINICDENGTISEAELRDRAMTEG